ncbi:MAG: V-type ATP synthase subunit F [Clostridia bacterium]|nr:V-type ATP synthase subunit F [Clostridia bacterium]
MYKIGMIGERDSVLGFMALGFSVFDTESAEEAKLLLREKVKSGEFAVIFVTEGIAVLIEDEIEKYKDIPLPAIVSLPGADGGKGYGMENIRQAALRAVGADILSDKT